MCVGVCDVCMCVCDLIFFYMFCDLAVNVCCIPHLTHSTYYDITVKLCIINHPVNIDLRRVQFDKGTF